MAQAKIHSITKEYPEGTTWIEVVQEHQKECECDILLVRVNGKLQELHKQVKDCELSSATAKDKLGMSAYQRSASLMVLKASYSMVGPGSVKKLMIDFSTGRGFFMEAGRNFVLDQEFLDAVKAKMKEYVKRKIPIMKRSVPTDDVIELFEKLGMYGKARLFRYCMVSRINIYSIDGLGDYYYGYTMQNMGYIKHFDPIPYHYGFVMVVPDKNTPDILHKLIPSDKLFATSSESMGWGRWMDLETVGALGDRIAKGGILHLTLVQGAPQEKKAAETAAQITAKRNIRSIMITGPSSSDKTIFSYRLSIQLETIGLKPYPIAVGNCFVNHVDNPRNEHDNYNYEIPECLDVELFNRDVTGLLERRRVELPYYNFKKGVRKYKRNFLQLREGDILVIEGTCYLNGRLSYTLPTDSKSKIYISALTQLNIDEHNRIPTTDGWLLRGMARSVRTRGSPARKTIRTWPSVRRGKEENISPFQEKTDAMLNSVLVYELAVLKQYTQLPPSTISRDSEEWLETKRLPKSLDYFTGVSSEGILKNPILRGFIGGDCLNV